jgi:HK97 family phage portal protein
MGVLDYLKFVFGGKQSKYRAWLANSMPIFSSFGNNIYLSDFVNNAIDRSASEISKIELKSVIENGGRIQLQNDDITRLFRFKPNPLQTSSDFFSNVEWLRRKDRNAFIYPMYETITIANGTAFKKFTAFYPLKPMRIYIGINDGQVWEIKMDFEDGSSYTLPYSELIHLKWRRGSNTVIGGGDDYGEANDYDVLRTVDALDKTIQGLPKSIEASLQISGVYHAKTLADAAKLSTLRDDFESHLMKSKTGIVATDIGGEFTPVNIKAAEIPETALKFLKSVIQERYGISAAILSGDYNGDQHSAFYQTAIEDFIIQLEQSMTAACFTPREQDVGHRIKAYYRKVNYMSTSDKKELANLAKETGIMTLNQINEMFGVEPFEGGDRRLQSLNFMNIDVIDEYQKSKAGVTQEPGISDSGDTAIVQDVAKDVSGKSLNSAQTQSLLSVMEQYTKKQLTMGQAINIISISIGISKKEAKDIIEGLNEE